MSEDYSSAFPAFAFAGVAKHRQGWGEPVSIRVEPPVSDRPNEYVCAGTCTLLGGPLRPARSSTPQHAYALAFRLLRYLLSDFALFDGSGKAFALPRVPPEEDDWRRTEPTPETGMTLHVQPVDSEGEIRPFVAGVSVPKAENDGYTADVRFGAINAPTITIRAKTPADTFYSGIEWIEDRLDTDGLVLLGLWNEPIELPKRPKS